MGTTKMFLGKNMFTRNVLEEMTPDLWSSLTMVDLTRNMLCTTNANGSEIHDDKIVVYMDICSGTTTTQIVPGSTPRLPTIMTRRRWIILQTTSTPGTNTTDGTTTVSPVDDDDDNDNGNHFVIAGSLGISIPLVSTVGLILVFCIRWRRGRWAARFDLRRATREETGERPRVEDVGMVDMRQVAADCEGAVGGDGMENVSLKTASSDEDMKIFAQERATLRQRTPSRERV